MEQKASKYLFCYIIKIVGNALVSDQESAPNRQQWRGRVDYVRVTDIMVDSTVDVIPISNASCHMFCLKSVCICSLIDLYG